MVYGHILSTVTLTLVGPSSPVTTGELSAAWNLVYGHILGTVTLTLDGLSSPVITGELCTTWELDGKPGDPL